MQAAARLLILASLAVALWSCDVGDSNLNVDNRSSQAYLVQIGERAFLIPASRRLTAFAWGMGRPHVQIRLLDPDCEAVWDAPGGRLVGTIVIDSSGAVSFQEDNPGTANQAQESKSCDLVAPSATPAAS